MFLIKLRAKFSKNLEEKYLKLPQVRILSKKKIGSALTLIRIIRRRHDD